MADGARKEDRKDLPMEVAGGSSGRARTEHGEGSSGPPQNERTGPPRDGIRDPPRSGRAGPPRDGDRSPPLVVRGLPRGERTGPPHDVPRDHRVREHEGSGCGDGENGYRGEDRRRADERIGPPRDGNSGPPREEIRGPPRDGNRGPVRDGSAHPSLSQWPPADAHLLADGQQRSVHGAIGEEEVDGGASREGLNSAFSIGFLHDGVTQGASNSRLHRAWRDAHLRHEGESRDGREEASDRALLDQHDDPHRVEGYGAGRNSRQGGGHDQQGDGRAEGPVRHNESYGSEELSGRQNSRERAEGTGRQVLEGPDRPGDALDRSVDRSFLSNAVFLHQHLDRSLDHLQTLREHDLRQQRRGAQQSIRDHSRGEHDVPSDHSLREFNVPMDHRVREHDVISDRRAREHEESGCGERENGYRGGEGENGYWGGEGENGYLGGERRRAQRGASKGGDFLSLDESWERDAASVSMSASGTASARSWASHDTSGPGSARRGEASARSAGEKKSHCSLGSSFSSGDMRSESHHVPHHDHHVPHHDARGDVRWDMRGDVHWVGRGDVRKPGRRREPEGRDARV